VFVSSARRREVPDGEEGERPYGWGVARQIYGDYYVSRRLEHIKENDYRYSLGGLQNKQDWQTTLRAGDK
jgi:hypothetical protein